MANGKSTVDQEVTEKLDEYLIWALEEMKTIARDPNHPEHKRHCFEAIKMILKHTAPIRKEQTQPESDITLQIGALFHGNSLEDKTDVKEIEVVDQDISKPKTET